MLNSCGFVKTCFYLRLLILFHLRLSVCAVEAVVEFDYEAQQDDELTLTVGDIIKNIRRDDGGWWEGELGGRRGFFPDNFVRVSNHKGNPHFLNYGVSLLFSPFFFSVLMLTLVTTSCRSNVQFGVCLCVYWCLSVVECPFRNS